MLLKQQFKTLEGAGKRARFENAHCGGKYRFSIVRCVNGEPDTEPFGMYQMSDYTWRLAKTSIGIKNVTFNKPEKKDV